MMAAERGGIVMLAEIAMRQALAHGQPATSAGASKKGGKELYDHPMMDSSDDWFPVWQKRLRRPFLVE
jgi:hypothetical protein